MEKNQNNQPGQNKSGNLTNEKTYEDYNKKQPNPNDLSEGKRNPDIREDDKETMVEERPEKTFNILASDNENEEGDEETEESNEETNEDEIHNKKTGDS
ncbi:MAG: hypothetical protein H7Y00_11400 [Fimbriimonadaceae bacterium]|nr:hypothetical protein [Chitinophagales bacterium]